MRDIQNGIIIETLMAKKHKKTPEEKAAVAKQKRKQRRAKRKKEADVILEQIEKFQPTKILVYFSRNRRRATYC